MNAEQFFTNADQFLCRGRGSALYLVAVLLCGWCFFLTLRLQTYNADQLVQSEKREQQFRKSVGYTDNQERYYAALRRYNDAERQPERERLGRYQAIIDQFDDYQWDLDYSGFGTVGLALLLAAGFGLLAAVYLPKGWWGPVRFLMVLPGGLGLVGGLIWVTPYVSGFLWKAAVSTWDLAYWLATSREYLTLKVAAAVLFVGAAFAYDYRRRPGGATE